MLLSTNKKAGGILVVLSRAVRIPHLPKAASSCLQEACTGSKLSARECRGTLLCMQRSMRQLLSPADSALLLGSSNQCDCSLLLMQSLLFIGRMQPDHIKKGYCPRLPGVRMPATYINHYCANGGVVVPQFGGRQLHLCAACEGNTRERIMDICLPGMLTEEGSTSMAHMALRACRHRCGDR